MTNINGITDFFVLLFHFHSISPRNNIEIVCSYVVHETAR